jgi:hypothetical protein
MSVDLTTAPTTPSGNISQLHKTPALFHWTMGILAGSNAVRSIWAMRLANCLLALMLILGALYAARGSLRTAIAISWIVAIIPLGLYTIASTNPSSWAIIGLGTYWAYLLAYWRAPDSRAQWIAGVGTVVSAIVASGARTDAAAFVVVVTIAMAIFEWLPRRGGPRINPYLLMIPVICLLSGLIVFRRSAQAGVAMGGLPTDGVSYGSGPSLLFRNVQELPTLWSAAFGGWGLGWLDTVIPSAVSLSVTALFVALVFAGLRRTGVAKNLALMLIFLLVSALPLWILQQSQEIVGFEVQPRYLLPALLVLLGVALASQGSAEVLSLSGTQKAVAWAVVSGAQAVSLMFVIRRYAIGTDGSLFIRGSQIEWWSTTLISPKMAMLIAAIAYAWLAYVVFFKIALRVPDPSTISATPVDPTSAPSR